MRFRPEQHIRHSACFQRIRAYGVFSEQRAFVLYYHHRDSSEASIGTDKPRLGVIASRRVGNAVKRNRAKRKIRELFRSNQTSLPFHSDVVIIIRKHFYQYSHSSLQSHFLRGIDLCQQKRIKIPAKKSYQSSSGSA